MNPQVVQWLQLVATLVVAGLAGGILMKLLELKPAPKKQKKERPNRPKSGWKRPVVNWKKLQELVTPEVLGKVDWSTWLPGEFLKQGDGGDGDNVAHPSLVIGSKNGPMGIAWAILFGLQSAGHTILMAVLAPCTAAKPAALGITEVTIQGAKAAVQMAGPFQSALADAIRDCVKAGILPQERSEELCIICQGFVHWDAFSDEEIYFNNYYAIVHCIVNAVTGKPTAEEVVASDAQHPFRGCHRAPEPPVRSAA